MLSSDREHGGYFQREKRVVVMQALIANLVATSACARVKRAIAVGFVRATNTMLLLLAQHHGQTKTWWHSE